MTKTHLVIPDPHAHPDYGNERADWLGKLILDAKPDVVINLGDQWDMSSLSAYDRGKASFSGRNYKKDIEAGLEFSDRLWGPLKRAKRKQPYSVYIEGNHEERIRRVLEIQPELDGAISYRDLDITRYYHTFVPYTGSTPGIIELDGVVYAHFMVSGVMGRPISGEHPSYTLLEKQFQSVTVGHTHTFDFCQRTTATGKRIQALVAGCYTDQVMPWAGEEICKMWCPGVVLCHDVEDGHYDLEWVSLQRLKKEYGN